MAATRKGRYRRLGKLDAVRESGGVVGYIDVDYGALRKVLGPPMPSESDDYKVSTAWAIIDDTTGKVFRVYDYKETSLYSRDKPSVRAFRAKNIYTWHIGGTVDPRDFGTWLASATGGFYVSVKDHDARLKAMLKM